MTDDQRRGLVIHEVLVRYCHEVDHGTPEAVADLFTADAVLEIDGRRLEGRDAIYDFYRKRAGKGIQSRHVITNIVLHQSGDGEVHALSTLLHFRDGVLPVLVGDYHDVVLEDEGKWRFASKRLEIAFRGPALSEQRADAGAERGSA